MDTNCNQLTILTKRIKWYLQHSYSNISNSSNMINCLHQPRTCKQNEDIYILPMFSKRHCSSKNSSRDPVNRFAVVFMKKPNKCR